MWLLDGDGDDTGPENLLLGCKKLESDCSTFLFYHCDLRPTNILVVPPKGTLGIIDWETAGFVPKEWIRTRFRVCSSMDLTYISHDDPYSRADWRHRVARQLGEEGYPDATEQYVMRRRREKEMDERRKN